MKKHDKLYNYAKTFLTNKDRYVDTFVDTYIDKMQSAFTYDGLPDTIPKEELEKQLLEYGECFVTNVNGDLYALQGSAGGEGDAYNRPTLYTVANAYLRLSATYKIGVDGVLCKNDYKSLGIMPLLLKSSVKMCDIEMSVNLMTILHRMSYMISASDDKTKLSAELFIKKLIDGEYSIIGENSFFDGVKLHVPPTGQGTYITQYIELMQYEKAWLLNELGLKANYNMKREALNEKEVALNIDAILPFIDDMYHQRLIAMDSINKMFGTNIKVDFGSAWKTLREEREKETAVATTDTIILGESNLSSVPSDDQEDATLEDKDEATREEDEATREEDEATREEDERKEDNKEDEKN